MPHDENLNMAKTTKKHPVPPIEGNEGAVSPAFAAFFRNALMEQRERIKAGSRMAAVAFFGTSIKS